MAITPGTSSSAIAQPLAPYTRALPGLYGPGDPTISATVVHQQRPILAPFFVNNGLPEIVGPQQWHMGDVQQNRIECISRCPIPLSAYRPYFEH